MTGSCLYLGSVVHQRLRPRRHALRYRVFSLLLDLDEIPALARRMRLFSHNRFNLFAFADRDHGARDGSALRPFVEAALARAGIALEGGAIRILCFPRMLGYVFNPLSIYFCHHRDGSLRAVLYEVRNTFGQMHSYLIPVGAVGASGEVLRQSCEKSFYVSPFMAMECRYEFRLAVPGERLAVTIRQTDAEGPILHASLEGRRATLDDRALAGAFLRYPLMTLKVIAGIHWEAAKLWRKGLRPLPRPAPPADSITICAAVDP
ncbi:MAG TPA: DUF1365 family protein [Stellaceae bacterium]|nr:DUF1365 family protein [Stellaceae bacterium]